MTNFLLVLLLPSYLHFLPNLCPSIQLTTQIIEYDLCSIYLNPVLYLHECQCIFVIHVIYLFPLINHIYNRKISNINWQFTIFNIPLVCIDVRGFDIMFVQQLFCRGFGHLSFRILNITTITDTIKLAINYLLMTYTIFLLPK